MGLFENFPYTDFHRLNLDWILKFTKNVKNRLDDIDAAVIAAISAKEDAEDAADIANDAKTDAVDAKNTAVSAKNDAEDAKDAAVSAKNDAVDAKDAAVDAKDDAVDAKNDAVDAKNDAVDAKNDAQDAATAAAGSAATAGDAEAWAVGTSGGVPVPVTADQYENNAKYWAQQAGQSPALNVYNLATEYFDQLTLSYRGVWGYRYVEADNDTILFIALGEKESQSQHVGALSVSIEKIISGVPTVYAMVEEPGTDDPTGEIGVETVAFIKLAAGEKVRLAAYRHDYLTGTPTMIAEMNIIAIGGTVTIDNAYTPI